MPNRESTPSRRITVISPNGEMVAELNGLLKTQNLASSPNHLQAYPRPADLTASFKPGEPNLVYLDLTSNVADASDLLTQLHDSGIQVIALLSMDDPDLILSSLRLGAVDFLIQPFSKDQLDAALAKLAKIQLAVDPLAKHAKILTVMPAKGACGATTLACNLAFQWKRTGGSRILLMDMDPLAGTMSFLLKIKSTYSFLDALQRSHELDADLWNAMVTSVGGIDVMLAPELLAESPQELRDPLPVIDYARQIYDTIIVDAGGVYGEWNLALAKTSNEAVLVTTNELPALQAAQRALSYLETNRIGRGKVRLVVNRYERDIGLNRDVIGTALHMEVFDILPSDYDAVQRALMEGKPVPAGAPFGKSVSQLADRLGGSAAAAQDNKKGSGLGSLFSFLKK